MSVRQTLRVTRVERNHRRPRSVIPPHRSYDARDRLLTINYPTGTADTSFTYYDDGKLDTATRGTSKWDLNWLNRGLLDDETLTVTSTPTAPGSPYTIDYDYNNRGQRNLLQYPSGIQVALDPDALGRPTKLGAYVGNIAYATHGAPASFSYGNGTAMERDFNTRDLIAATRYTLGGFDLTDRSLIYDEDGNLASITDAISGPADRIFASTFDGTPATGTDSRSFVYDAVHRLTDMVSSRYGVDHYRYDPLGNVRSHSVGGGTITYTYTAATNRILSANTNSYDHDTRGNVTRIGSFDLTYNRANELISDEYLTTFAYDARGWRFQQNVVVGADHTRYFIYNHQGRLLERIDNGEVTDFIYLGRTPVARRTGTENTYIHTDYQNSPLLETHAGTGNVTRSPVYLAYGQSASNQGTKAVIESPGYAGSYPDPETGISYMGARYYNAPRFLAPDPAALNPLSPVGLNRFAYASANPVRYTDPTGRTPDDGQPCDEACPDQPPPPPPDVTPLPTITVTATTATSVTIPWPSSTPVIPWSSIGRGAKWLGGRLSVPFMLLLPTTMGAAPCEMPGGPLCGMMTSGAFPPGCWPGDSGAAEWGKRNGVGAREGKGRFHGIKQKDRGQGGGRARDRYGVNPQTGDVANPQGEIVGNLKGEKSK